MEFYSIEQGGNNKIFFSKTENGYIFPICDTKGRIHDPNNKIKSIKSFGSYNHFCEHISDSFKNHITKENIKDTGINKILISGGEEEFVKRRKTEKEDFEFEEAFGETPQEIWDN